jgi:hypothetical protein
MACAHRRLKSDRDMPRETRMASKLEPTPAALVDTTVSQSAPAPDTVNVMVKYTGSVKDLLARAS